MQLDLKSESVAADGTQQQNFNMRAGDLLGFVSVYVHVVHGRLLLVTVPDPHTVPMPLVEQIRDRVSPGMELKPCPAETLPGFHTASFLDDRAPVMSGGIS